MNTDARLNLRARQIMDDPTLSPNQRLSNAAALLKALARSGQVESMLAEITDDAIRVAMRAAIDAELAG